MYSYDAFLSDTLLQTLDACANEQASTVDVQSIRRLKELGLVVWDMSGEVSLTAAGWVCLAHNKKVREEIKRQNTQFWITTILAAFALVVSIAAIVVSFFVKTRVEVICKSTLPILQHLFQSLKCL